MLVTIILYGSVLSVGIGMFIVTGCANNAKRPIVGVIVGTLISCLIGFGFVSCCAIEENNAAKTWNNGACSQCETPWHLQSVAKSRHNTTYYYTCENNHVFSTEYLFEK